MLRLILPTFLSGAGLAGALTPGSPVDTGACLVLLILHGLKNALCSLLIYLLLLGLLRLLLLVAVLRLWLVLLILLLVLILLVLVLILILVLILVLVLELFLGYSEVMAGIVVIGIDTQRLLVMLYGTGIILSVESHVSEVIVGFRGDTRLILGP